MIPAVTRKGMIEVDRVMIEDLEIPVTLMMEHAGLNLARISRKYMDNNDLNSILVVAGSGNNGAGGLVAARRLQGWNISTEIILPKGSPKREVPKAQLKRAKNVGATVISSFEESQETDQLIIDAFIGYNFRGQLRSNAAEVVKIMKSYPIICLDIPTGIDSSTGKNHGELEPIATVTLAWPKLGLLSQEAKNLGTVYLADIGIPIDLYDNEELYKDNPPTVNQLNLVKQSFQEDAICEIQYSASGWKFV